MIEWDSKIPEWSIYTGELNKIELILNSASTKERQCA
jgi:hypothetical protein